MKAHPPYTEPDWQREEVQRLAGSRFECPDCGSDKDFGPKAHLRADNSERHYRACKICGFWQEADGSPPYRVWLATHDCVIRLRPGQLVAKCTTCGNSFTVPPGTTEVPHSCGRFLTPMETGFICSNCLQFIDRSHGRAMESTGSDVVSPAAEPDRN